MHAQAKQAHWTSLDFVIFILVFWSDFNPDKLLNLGCIRLLIGKGKETRGIEEEAREEREERVEKVERSVCLALNGCWMDNVP